MVAVQFFRIIFSHAFSFSFIILFEQKSSYILGVSALYPVQNFRLIIRRKCLLKDIHVYFEDLMFCDTWLQSWLSYNWSWASLM